MPEALDMPPPVCRRIQALAERDPHRAVPLAYRALDQLQDGNPLIRAWAEYTLGWALLCWERFGEARPYLQLARDAFEAGRTCLPALRCRFALLLADLMQYAHPGLEHDLAALAGEFERVDAPSDAVRVWLYQAVLFNVLGRPRDAKSVLDQLSPLIAEGTLADRAHWLRVYGATATWHNDYAKATDLLTQAEQFFASLRYRLDRAKCWAELAWCMLRQEQLDAALVNYQRAEHLFTQLDLPLRSALCAKEICLLMMRRGAYDLALHKILHALKYFANLGRIRDQAGCQLQLGNIYFYTARWEAALACYERAEALYVAGEVIGESLIVRRNRALVYRIRGRYAEAQQLLADIEVQAQELDNRAELAEIWMEQAELLAADERIEEALLRYQHARDLFAQIGHFLDVAECDTKLGWLTLHRGEVDKAWAHFCSAAPVVVPHPYYQWRTEYGLARCAEARGDDAEALAHYRTALATVAGLRRRLASEEVSSGLYTQAAQLHIDALRLTVARGEAAAALDIGEGQRALVLRRRLAARAADLPAEYQAEHDRLRNEIGALLEGDRTMREAHGPALDSTVAAYGELLLHARHATPQLKPASPEPPFDLDQLRVALRTVYGTDWSALAYMLNGDTLLIALVTPDELALDQVAFDARLQRLIERASRPEYRYYIYRDLPYLTGQGAQPWAGLRALAERLLPDRVRARLRPGHRLLIVPAGPLHGLPWAALRLEESWLAQRAVVQLAPSLAAWQMLAQRPPANAGGALLVGCGAFGGRAPELPAVAEELAVVAERWPGAATQLLHEQATRGALIGRSARGELAQCSLLHLATHAQLLLSRGLAAHLKLWDGDLLLPEIVSLRLGGTVTVLSACNGAAVDPLPGEEMLSLSWAFLSAGASGVLASLWPVEDQAGIGFIAAFYDALREHRDAALALAQAQRALIAAGASGEPAAEPQCWGSFVLTGIGQLP